MREIIDSLPRVDRMTNAFREDTEYEYVTTFTVKQKKGVLGYKDYILFEDKEDREKFNQRVNDVIQYCKKYGLSYAIDTSESYSEDSTFYWVKRCIGRIKTIKKTVLFTLTSEVKQQMVHEYSASMRKEAIRRFIGASDGWYQQMKDSDAVKAIANEMVPCIKTYFENEADCGFKNLNLTCWSDRAFIEDYPKTILDIYYKDLGYKNLSSNKQYSAVIAALIPYFEEVLRSISNVFDYFFYPKSDADGMSIHVLYNVGVKQLKSW